MGSSGSGLGEPGDGGRLEDGPERHLDLEGVPGPGDDLDRQERVPAELREALVHADTLALEDVAPDGGQHLLDGPPRLDIVLVLGRALDGWQGAAIDLAVGRERQGLQRHERRGDHGLREPLPHVGAELHDVRSGLALRRDHVGDERSVSARIGPGHDHRGRERGVGQEQHLDLAGLDAVAADLDLIVRAAEEHQRPVR
jgi:hypothetical protein